MDSMIYDSMGLFDFIRGARDTAVAVITHPVRSFVEGAKATAAVFNNPVSGTRGVIDAVVRSDNSRLFREQERIARQSTTRTIVNIVSTGALAAAAVVTIGGVVEAGLAGGTRAAITAVRNTPRALQFGTAAAIVTGSTFGLENLSPSTIAASALNPIGAVVGEVVNAFQGNSPFLEGLGVTSPTAQQAIATVATLGAVTALAAPLITRLIPDSNPLTSTSAIPINSTPSNQFVEPPQGLVAPLSSRKTRARSRKQKPINIRITNRNIYNEERAC